MYKIKKYPKYHLQNQFVFLIYIYPFQLSWLTSSLIQLAQLVCRNKMY
uniref:Uncharacterized protein n=1 Tax=Lepeophtheirus salmonis TaxID=72036 RepID=A0A0K2V025_LEPSM